MINFRYENIWRMLDEFRLEIISDVSDLTCVICKNVLKNACNGPCGCRYCLDCINKYLEGKNKFCPRNMDECKQELLTVDKNVFIDNAANSRVSRIIVKCPEESCQFKGELRKIEDHIMVCDKKIMKCPYFDIGCVEAKVASGKISDHLVLENYSHTKTLMNCIQNLKNEMALMKDSHLEMKSIKDESVRRQHLIMDMQDKIADFKRKFVQKCDENIHLKLKLQQTNHKFEEFRRQIELKQDTIENQLIEVLLENDKLKFRADENQRFAEILYGKLECLERDTHLVKQNYGSILWKIENFTQKRKEAQSGLIADIYSEPFYSNKYGYKMCLQLHPDGFKTGKGTNLSVFFYIMRGENDAILSWPMKLEVTIGIINQETNDIHTSYKFNYDPILDKYRPLFDKPKSDMNVGYGYDFIKLDELMKNNKLLKSDKIVLKCSVAPVKDK